MIWWWRRPAPGISAGGVNARTLSGVGDKTGDGRTIFLPDAVHVDFALKAA
jgi:hypothetical protein